MRAEAKLEATTTGETGETAGRMSGKMTEIGKKKSGVGRSLVNLAESTLGNW